MERVIDRVDGDDMVVGGFELFIIKFCVGVEDGVVGRG